MWNYGTEPSRLVVNVDEFIKSADNDAERDNSLQGYGRTRICIENPFTFGKCNINTNILAILDMYDRLINAFKISIGYLERMHKASASAL